MTKKADGTKRAHPKKSSPEIREFGTRTKRQRVCISPKLRK